MAAKLSHHVLEQIMVLFSVKNAELMKVRLVGDNCKLAGERVNGSKCGITCLMQVKLAGMVLFLPQRLVLKLKGSSNYSWLYSRY